MKRGNKRGQALSMQTIIIIILAVIVLVFIVLHFTGGLQTIWGRMIGEYTQADLEAARTTCKYRDVESFCTEPVQLYRQKTKEYIDVMCWGKELKVKIKDDEGKIVDKSYCQEHHQIEEE